jgi:hypothetical protein
MSWTVAIDPSVTRETINRRQSNRNNLTVAAWTSPTLGPGDGVNARFKRLIKRHMLERNVAPARDKYAIRRVRKIYIQPQIVPLMAP